MFFLHCISSKIQPLDLLFLVVFIRFYIKRYNFSQIFKTSFGIIWKKDFCHKFSFFNKVTEPSQPLKLKRWKATKHDKSFLLMVPNERDFAQDRKSFTYHLFISYLRNLCIIIYIYINYIHIYYFLSKISEIFP